MGTKIKVVVHEFIEKLQTVSCPLLLLVISSSTLSGLSAHIDTGPIS